LCDLHPRPEGRGFTSQEDKNKKEKLNIELIYASANEHLNIVKYLVAHGVNIHSNNNVALIQSSKNGHLNIVKFLVEQGADIHANYNAALIQSSKNGHLEIVKYLAEQDAKIKKNRYKIHKNTVYLKIRELL
jgi:ankyrin repeat protein